MSKKKPKGKACGTSKKGKRTSSRQALSTLPVKESSGWVPVGGKKPPQGVEIELALFITDVGARTVILGWLEGDDFIAQSPESGMGYLVTKWTLGWRRLDRAFYKLYEGVR